MKKITVFTVLAALVLAGCAKGPEPSIESLSQHTGAAQSSYPTKATPVATDKVLITDSEASNVTRQATVGSLPLGFDSITLSATSPILLDPDTGVFSMAENAYQAYSTVLGNIATNWPAGVTMTEVGYLDGVTSGVQAQINALSISGFSPTIQSADPTVASATGMYMCTGSGHTFYKYDSGLFDVSAGTFAPYYSLTITGPAHGTIATSDSDLSVAINCGTGGSACLAYSASGASITGITATGDSGYTCTLSGDISSGSVTMSANKTGTASCVTACDSGLLTNGCFDDGTTGWSVTGGATNTITVTDGVLTFTENEGSYEGVKQAVTLTNGASYTLTYDVTANSGNAYVYIGGTPCADILTTGAGQTATCNAGTDDEVKFVSAGGSPRSFSIDNVKLTAN